MWLNWLSAASAVGDLSYFYWHLSGDPLVDRVVTKRVQKNFQPFPSTNLCEESCSMVQHHVLGLRGNLTDSLQSGRFRAGRV
jgi:hypothetical protein